MYAYHLRSTRVSPRCLIAVAVIAGLASWALRTPASAAPPGPGVTICHIPPGNPDASVTIIVSPRAVDMHLAHGDFIGECECDS